MSHVATATAVVTQQHSINSTLDSTLFAQLYQITNTLDIAHRKHEYNIITLAIAPKPHEYNINRTLDITLKTHEYNIITLDIAPKPHEYNINRTLDITLKPHEYNIITLAIAPKPHEYNINRTLDITLKTHEYNIITLAIAPKPHEYNINRTSDITLKTHEYNIITLDIAPKPHEYNIHRTSDITLKTYEYNITTQDIAHKPHEYNIHRTPDIAQIYTYIHSHRKNIPHLTTPLLLFTSQVTTPLSTTPALLYTTPPSHTASTPYTTSPPSTTSSPTTTLSPSLHTPASQASLLETTPSPLNLPHSLSLTTPTPTNLIRQHSDTDPDQPRPLPPNPTPKPQTINQNTSSSSSQSANNLHGQFQHIHIDTENDQTPTPTTATLTTSILHIARLPIYYTLDQIILDLTTISNMLQVDIDTEEFSARYNTTTAAHIYLRDRSRISIIVTLIYPATFSTTGSLSTPILPFFFFTASDRLNNRGTTRRLTVQALPADDIDSIKTSHEICCIRGLPDNCHTISAIFYLIWRDLLTNYPNEIPLLPLLTSKMNRRTIHTQTGQDEEIFVDEVFLRVHAPSSDTASNIRNALHIPPTHPIPHAALNWHGEIAHSHQSYQNTPTNTANLLYQPTSILILDTTETLQELLHQVHPHLISPISFAYLIHGIIDSPWLPNTSNILVLSSQQNGTVPEFNEATWSTTFPNYPPPRYLFLPGYEALALIYAQDPPPPQPSANTIPRLHGGARLTGTELTHAHPLPLITPPTRNPTPPRRGPIPYTSARSLIPNTTRTNSTYASALNTQSTPSNPPTPPPVGTTLSVADRLTRLEETMDTLQQQNRTLISSNHQTSHDSTTLTTAVTGLTSLLQDISNRLTRLENNSTHSQQPYHPQYIISPPPPPYYHFSPTSSTPPYTTPLSLPPNTGRPPLPTQAYTHPQAPNTNNPPPTNE